MSEIRCPAPGLVYQDRLNRDELVEVLHVGSSHVIVQRRNGVNRYPRADFGEGQRFSLDPFAQKEAASS